MPNGGSPPPLGAKWTASPPSKTPMTTLTRAHLAGGPFPLALPMDKDIDVVALDQNALDGKLQLDGLKGVEVALDLPLDLIQIAGWQQQSFQRIPVPFDVGFSEQLHPPDRFEECGRGRPCTEWFFRAPDTEYQ